MDDAIVLFEQLLKAESEDKVDAILKRAEYGLENESAWQPLGGMENNFSTVGNQQTEATAALVEKIINGLDADLMAECFPRQCRPRRSRSAKDNGRGCKAVLWCGEMAY